MDLNFVEPSEAPVPPEQVRVRRIELKPFPDRRRIKVQVELTPFHERPSLEVKVRDPEGETVAAASIIESVNHELEFTLHLRKPPRQGKYILEVQAVYGEREPVDVKSADFRLT